MTVEGLSRFTPTKADEEPGIKAGVYAATWLTSARCCSADVDPCKTQGLQGKKKKSAFPDLALSCYRDDGPSDVYGICIHGHRIYELR